MAQAGAPGVRGAREDGRNAKNSRAAAAGAAASGGQRRQAAASGSSGSSGSSSSSGGRRGALQNPPLACASHRACVFKYEYQYASVALTLATHLVTVGIGVGRVLLQNPPERLLRSGLLFLTQQNRQHEVSWTSHPVSAERCGGAPVARVPVWGCQCPRTAEPRFRLSFVA